MWSWGKFWVKLGPMLRKKSKETGIINRFYYILHGEYILKQEVVVAQTPEWKLKTNIARNAKFQGH